MAKILIPGLAIKTLGIIRPDPFTFVDQTDVPPDSPDITSNQITVTGTPPQFNLNISIDVGQYQVNSDPWTGAPGTVVAGDLVRVRHTSASGFSQQVHSTLTIQGVSDTFTTTTNAGAQPSWTLLAPSADSLIIYVDATNGSAGGTAYTYGVNGSGIPGGTNDHENPIGENAFQTISQGLAQMRSGFPDYLLFKRGETWTNEVFNEPTNFTGRGVSELAVIGAYGSGPRPVFEFGSTQNFFYHGGGPGVTIENAIITSLDMYQPTNDTTSPGFVQPTVERYAIRMLRGYTNLTIEDCAFRYIFTTPISSQPLDGSQQGLTVRGCLFYICYGRWNTQPTGIANLRSSGMFLTQMSGSSVVEYNYLYHCGWNDDAAEGFPNPYNHGAYINYSNNEVRVNNNLAFDCSAHGLMQRCSGDSYENLAVRNGIGILHGNTRSEPQFQNVTGDVTNNTILESHVIPDPPVGYNTNGFNVGWGMRLEQTLDCTASGCIAANLISGGDTGIVNSGGGTGNTNLTITGSIIHDWAGSDTGVPGDYVDPERTLAGYNASVGGAGTDAAFVSALLAQHKQNWNSNYHIPTIKAWIDAGFDAAP